jgi:hypothetical protein
VFDHLDRSRRRVEEDLLFLVSDDDVIFWIVPAAVVGDIDVQVAVIVIEIDPLGRGYLAASAAEEERRDSDFSPLR